MLAVFETAVVCEAGIVTVTVIALDSPTTMVAAWTQLTVAPTVPTTMESQVQPAPDTESKAVPAGSGSLIEIGPSETEGPRLVTATS